MILIALTAIVARWFYSLASKFGRSKWGYGLLGAGIFIGVQLILGLIIGGIILMTEDDYGMTTSVSSQLLLNLAGMAAGFLVAWLIHRQLKKKWETAPNNKRSGDELLDDQL